ncbi:MAG: pyruvate, phosphate dikinase [Firmicutes bacterium]|jgi:pyruvate,orthophosphate dikinase|nr:pyruvate, phosphate dikinase [Bacillota bacterium]
MSRKYVYHFSEGGKEMLDLLGGKGANLAEMAGLGLPVPPGFTITTEACREYYRLGGRLPDGLEDEIMAALRALEGETGKTFGGARRPLLVSVRSGAAVSMPGMMDTVLNLGLNDDAIEGLYDLTRDRRFVLDCYRRFIQMFGNVVLRLDHAEFERALTRRKDLAGVVRDQEMDAGVLESVVDDFRQLVRRLTGEEFPRDPRVQLLMAVRAVFESWNNQRAIVYRRVNKIPDDLGTAVTVQSMVFGNMGDDSATGVVFTRNPSTGAPELYGEYLTNAQGEDVVAGIRTPRPISEMAAAMPDAYSRLAEACSLLESHYRDMQDIEFTVEKGRLYLLQTRSAKRTATAAVRVAVDFVREGKIGRDEALMMVEPDHVVKMLHRGIDPSAKVDVLAVGLPASPGAATGVVVFDADRAEALGQDGESVILVRPETTPDDMHGVVYSQGILTSRGGMTCHAAIVARGMGKPCVVGCDALKIDVRERLFTVGSRVVREGDVISIDGASGWVILGAVPVIDPKLSSEFKSLLEWADGVRRLGVRANADTPADARKAREFGAEGIGLCRTEHMFMQADRLPIVQEMILAAGAEERRSALDRLLPIQQKDFEEILEAMRGLPVTIRLLDPPLHEFLPNTEELVVQIAEARTQGMAGADIEKKEELLKKARALAESNPMLGFRGCRLGVVYPEIYEMQARAIFTATAALIKRGITDVMPEVMIPLVGHHLEIRMMKELVERTAEEVSRAQGVRVPCVVGTMIEVPRAALTADEIAEHAEFFSFGTNDLTQTTFGFSRDDAEAKFLHDYIQKKVLPDNPFAVLDERGVGRLVRMAVELGRSVKPALKIGICGEHGGEPRSIGFCHRAGLDYVSCSPFRVPVARLAAAQTALRERGAAAAS